MRFLYTLATLAFLSPSATAQTQANQVEPELVVQGSAAISFAFNNVNQGPNDIPGTYFPLDTSITNYVGFSLFTESNDGVNGIGVVYTPTGATAQGVVALRADGSQAIGCTSAPAGGNTPSPTDIANNISGKVVLVQRGTCSFVYKVQNAIAGGAVAVLIYNQASRAENPDPTTGDRVGAIIAAPGFTEQLTIPASLLPNGIAQPIVDEILAGGTVTLTLRAFGAVAAEPTVGTTASGLEVRGANPFATTTQLRVTSEFAEAVRVEVYNVRGQLVRTLLDGIVAGERMVPLSSEGLAAGVYFVRATGETFRSQQQVTVLR